MIGTEVIRGLAGFWGVACLTILGSLPTVGAQISFNAAGGVLTNGGRQVLAAAWADVDGDGRSDIYLAPLDFGIGGLFLNKSTGFLQVNSGDAVTNAMARGGAAWGDFDNDGRADLLSVGTSGYPPMIYRNAGDDGLRALPVISESQASIGTTGIWVDYDNDGLLDIFTANGGGGVAEANKLVHNLGNGQFEVVKSGVVAEEIEASHGAAFGDYDGDGDLDLFVAEAWVGSRLYRNEGAGRFVRDPSGDSQDGATSRNASSAAWGDLDNDGDLDLIVIAGGPEIRLYANDGSGQLSRIQAPPLTGNNGECASAAMADFDNDGWLDVLLSNRSGAPRLFRGLGQLSFEKVDGGGLTQFVPSGNGIAVADYDLDGDLDVFLGNWPGSSAPYLFRNDASTNAWLRVRLNGSLSSRDGIGAKVRIQTDALQPKTSQLRQIGGFDSVGSQELVAHFGLGTAANVGLLRVEWPSGTIQTLTNVAARQTVVLTEPTSSVRFRPQGGVFTNSVSVTLAGGIVGTEIRYTVDGSEPGANSATYSTPIQITKTTTLKARLFLNGFPVSDVSSAEYTADPGLAFSPPAGLFTNKVEVSMSSRLSGVEIHYTRDGSEPTTASALFSAPLDLREATTIKARAYFNGFPVTEVVTANYLRVYAFDSDGISATWREEYFGANYRTDPRAAVDADPDRDQSNNLQEFTVGTDPLDPLSGFKVGVRAVPEIRFTTVVGQKYQIRRRTSLSGAESVVVVEFIATETETHYVDVDAGVVANPAFYIVVPVP